MALFDIGYEFLFVFHCKMGIYRTVSKIKRCIGWNRRFLPRDAMHSADYAVARFLSVRLSFTCCQIGYTLFQKNVTTFWTISWTRTIRLQIGTLITKTIGHRQVFLCSHLTCLVQLLYLVKLSRPTYQQKLNKIMKISQEDVILIKIFIWQSSKVHVEHSVSCLTRVGNWEVSTVCWRKSSRRVPLSGYQAAVDRVQRMAVEDLVLSQEEKPKRHRLAR